MGREMTELKTLKDIELRMPENIYYSTMKPIKADGFMFVESKDLKKEAIKWIKHLAIINAGRPSIDDYILQRTGGQIDFIKNFFNITEDDLNETS